MNDVADKGVTDFHHAQVKLANLYTREARLKDNAEEEKPVQKQATRKEYVKFLPEGTQIVECKRRNYAFTADKTYEVIERDIQKYALKLKDDKGTEQWIKEDYFIPAEQKLFADKELGFSKPAPPKGDGLVWDAAEIPGDVPVIRRVSFSERAPDPTVIAEQSAVIGKEKTPEEKLCDMRSLAGVAGLPMCGNDKAKRKKKYKAVKNPDWTEEDQKELDAEWFTAKTVKSDDDNPLLRDFDAMLESVGKVFPEYRKLDSEVVMETVRKEFNHKRSIYWKDGFLQVDGAKTNIKKSDVEGTFNSLRHLTTPKAADKMVAKVIVKKLKKLF